MNDWEKNFCQNLRHLRKVHNLTQREMARIVGVSVNTLGKLERCAGSARIHCEMLCRVCVHFHIPVNEMLLENWPEMLNQ